jgi:small-conductance mechanosensitive channel
MNLNYILTRLIVFIIIILLGLIASKVVVNLIKKLMKEFEINKVFKRADINFNPNNFIPSLSKYIIYFVTLVIALDVVGITKIVFYIMIVVMALVIIIYVLISIKDLIPNWYCSFKVKKKYKIGNHINYKNIKGEIIHMNSVELQVKTKKEIIYIPYKLLK